MLLWTYHIMLKKLWRKTTDTWILLFFQKTIIIMGMLKFTKCVEFIINNQTIELNSRIRLIISHDSIWNYYENLECVAISFKQQGQRDFFSTLPKVFNLNQTTIDEIFLYCNANKISTIGFTPWAGGHYRHFIEKIKSHNLRQSRRLEI